MRRRLRRQRRLREAMLLDLGALVYELHRQGRRAPELLQEMAGELSAVDDEVRSLEETLGDGAGLDALFATGIVGSCAACGGLLNSGDRFCARCGAPAQGEPVTDEWEAPAAAAQPEAGEAEAAEGGAAEGEAAKSETAAGEAAEGETAEAAEDEAAEKEPEEGETAAPDAEAPKPEEERAQ
jgi:hypothetical protein